MAPLLSSKEASKWKVHLQIQSITLAQPSNHKKILIENPFLLKGSKLEVHHKILGMLMQIETTQDDNQDYERRCLNWWLKPNQRTLKRIVLFTTMNNTTLCIDKYRNKIIALLSIVRDLIFSCEGMIVSTKLSTHSHGTITVYVPKAILKHAIDKCVMSETRPFPAFL